jgi:hypothetical protein
MEGRSRTPISPLNSGTFDVRVTALPVARLLQGMLPRGLVARPRDASTIVIQRVDSKTPGAPLVTRLYDIRDLLEAERDFRASFRNEPGEAAPGDLWSAALSQGQMAEDSDTLIEIIEDTIDPPSWAQFDGPPTAVSSTFYGRLVVCNVPDVQRRVENFLAALRVAASSPSEPETGSSNIAERGR